MLFKSFPREVGPPRKTVYNIEEWLKFVNMYNGKKKAVYTSIYKFEKIESNGKPNYESAIVNKLFFDFDDKSCEGYKECNILHQFLLKEDIKHFIVMSGRGYHLYVLTNPIKPKNPKACIFNAQHNFIDKLKLTVDVQVIGNPAQLARVPNTFNTKGQRYCIPLTEEQFYKGDKYCKELASKQNFIKGTIIGNKLLDIKTFDSINNSSYENIYKASETSINMNANYAKDCPPCILEILKRKNLGWKERYLIIIYFRDIGYTREEVCAILKQHLTEQKFKHCIVDERQLQYLFERHDLIFPSCDRIMNDRLCYKKCDKYNCVIYK